MSLCPSFLYLKRLCPPNLPHSPLWTPINAGGRHDCVIGEDYQSLGFIANPIVTSTTPQQPARSFSLAQNFPNPFRGQTTITYELDKPGPISLHVYDLQGRMVSELAQGTQPAGTHSVSFDANRLPAGTYVYRLTAGRSVETRKMVVLK